MGDGRGAPRRVETTAAAGPSAAERTRPARHLVTRYCGRDFSEAELALLGALIAEDPSRTRADLSRLAYRALHWLKHDGGLKEMSCRVAMLRMQGDGLAQLPPPRCQRPQPRLRTLAETDPQDPIHAPAHALPALQPRLAGDRADSRLWNGFIHRYHYLGFQTLPGAQLRYWVSAGGRAVGLWCRRLAVRPARPLHRLGHGQRQQNLHLVVNNARFLILPWIRSENLASKILGLAARRLPVDWQRRYGYRPLLLETFVARDRFTGACYRAANWLHVGQTQGRGRLGPSGRQSVPIKDVWLYPLEKSFKKGLVR